MTLPDLRIIDSGVREGCLNIAYGQAMVDAHGQGLVPDTLRFLRFPPTAIIGRHQAISHEVNLAYCRENGVGLARRITGGGAIFLDEGQLGWELALKRSHIGNIQLADVTARICEAAARGLSSLGMDVRYRPRNDLEVGGRKISGTGGFFDGDTLFFQGTVLVDMDPQDMMAALNIPAAKLAKRDLASAAQRVVTIRDLLGDNTPDMSRIQEALMTGLAEGLGYDAKAGDFTKAEEELANRYFAEEIGRDEFLFEVDNQAAGSDVRTGEHTGPGGTITAHLRLEGPRQDRIREVVFTGDFFVTPPRTILDLEAALRRISLSDLNMAIDDFFAGADVDLLSVQPSDFAAALHDALRQSSAA